MSSKFFEFRNKYPNFIFDSYVIKKKDDSLIITYNFLIEGLTKFNPEINIPIYNVKVNENDDLLKYIAFNLGMVELISYVKSTCSPNIIVKCGYLDDKQINFFKKLYYNGLGEFLYLNNIDISENDLFNIICECDKKSIEVPSYNGSGNLIPVGGGKDSCVTLEILNKYKNDNYIYIVNPKEVMINCAEVAGYTQDKIIGVKRSIDKRLVELNEKGFLNGHTPFSAMIAFSSFLIAYIYKKKYIVLSNEGSANEATVLGTNINHQYSKTYEFENDFNNYTKEYFKINLSYFSLLRPLTEFQIGMLFSKYKKYHKIFKSCNKGSKSYPWNWCCNCSKCLFVYIILSPFLSKEDMIDIFKEDLYEKESLIDTFLELLGYGKTKPFDCVGTYEEVRYAVSLAILNRKELPYLLNYYKNHYELSLDKDYKIMFGSENNLPIEYENILRNEMNKNAK